MGSRRAPAVAGQFYPLDSDSCRALLNRILAPDDAPGAPAHSIDPIVSAVVPHAGWVYSGAVVGRVLRALPEGTVPNVVVIFGADHWGEARRHPEVYAEGSWETPIGEVEIDADLAGAVCAQGRGLIESRSSAHRREHSIEVHVPLIHALWPHARIVPILLSPGPDALLTGRVVARAAGVRDDVLVLGSSDLTHYGPRYGFMPEGSGQRGLDWVKHHNDAGIVRLMTELRADDIVPEAERHWNACGAGAITAAMAYARERGATRGELVEYTTSHDVRPHEPPSDFVGYAGVVFRAPRSAPGASAPAAHA